MSIKPTSSTSVGTETLEPEALYSPTHTQVSQVVEKVITTNLSNETNISQTGKDLIEIWYKNRTARIQEDTKQTIRDLCKTLEKDPNTDSQVDLFVIKKYVPDLENTIKQWNQQDINTVIRQKTMRQQKIRSQIGTVVGKIREYLPHCIAIIGLIGTLFCLIWGMLTNWSWTVISLESISIVLLGVGSYCVIRCVMRNKIRSKEEQIEQQQNEYWRNLHL